MRKIILAVASYLLCLAVQAQDAIAPDGGGAYLFQQENKDELTPEQRQAIVTMLQRNEQDLRRKGKLPAAQKTMAVQFAWPLAQSEGFYDNGYYGISNYVDHNSAFPGQLKDYNCGTRTYDLNSGYNHKGTDIFTWPFPWLKMQKNAVQVRAAAQGVIIGKIDGNPDQNCAFCTGPCNWNALYIRHGDGSVAWYGHLKTGSLLNKAVGETVSAGEYLGIVGSSGNSTGPHLHLEVYTNSNYTTLVDPWAGPCNALNGNTSWWANQQPYHVSTLNTLMTHGTAPAMGNCPGSEALNEKINFVSGDLVYYSSYYRDQLVGQQAIHVIYRPDGTVYHTWSHTAGNSYNASWWWWNFYLPKPAMQGMWRYSISFAGKPAQSVYFAVNTTGYVFIGNGNWSDAKNWLAESKPPAQLPAGHHIVINPVEGGACIVDQPQQISAGGKLKVEAGKSLLLPQNLIIQ